MTAVRGVGAVVAEDIAVVFGYDEWGEVVVVGLDVFGFGESFTVEDDFSGLNGDGVPRKSDNSFEPDLATVIGVFKGDEVVSFWVIGEVAVLSDQDEAAFLEGVAHVVSNHSEGCNNVFTQREGEANDEGGDEKSKGYVSENGIVVFEPIVRTALASQSSSIAGGVVADNREEGEGDAYEPKRIR